MSVTGVILLSIVYTRSTSPSVKDGLIINFLTGCLVASFVRNRLQQLFEKLFAYILITTTAYTIKKQRRRSALVFVVLNCVLFVPIGVCILVIASILSAPLLPLFTFPMFFIGFPRTKRFWPQKNEFLSSSFISTDLETKKNYNPSSDTSFYAQLVQNLIPSIKELIRSGSIGSSLQPESFFLSRFQDRIIWIQVMEASSAFCVLNIKGLELQETSCHTREAHHIDEAFEAAFETPDGPNDSDRNPTPFNCMQPCDVLIFDAYSDAKNSMVGVLDHPDSLLLITNFFPKILHYFLIKYLVCEKNVAQIKQDDPDVKPVLNKENMSVMFNFGLNEEIANPIDTNTNYMINNPIDEFEKFDEYNMIPESPRQSKIDKLLNKSEQRIKSSLIKNDATSSQNNPAFDINEEKVRKIKFNFEFITK